jgi:hypothetical protein
MLNKIAPPAFPDQSRWSGRLEAVSRNPLALCPEFPVIAARHEAWWRCEQTGGPLLIAAANRHPDKPILRRLDLLADPGAWLKARRPSVTQQVFSPDWFPFLRADFGPVMLGGLLGAPVDFVSDTTWTRHFIRDDWENAPDWHIHPENSWRAYLPALLETLARDAAGQYITCTPSLGGSADVLLNMRGPDPLCLDLLDRPDTILVAVESVSRAWQEAFALIWNTLISPDPSAPCVGVINWVGMWSNQPYHVLECDFNYLIGPREFERFFLPDIERQALAVGRGIFHLDGPGAARHIDALLEIDALQAIQYVAGAGNHAADWLPMLKKIQRKGRALQIACESEEIPELARRLEPNGLAFLTGYNREEDMLAAYHRLNRLAA